MTLPEWASPWVLWSVAGIVVAFALVIIYYQFQSDNKYEFFDILVDHETNRASLDSHITAFMALLSAWYIVVKTINPAAGNVGGDLVQILLVFLVYRVGKQAVQTWERKAPSPPQPPQPSGDNIGTQIVNTMATKPTGAVKTA